MTQADFDKDAIDWDAAPAEPVIHWQPRETAVVAAPAAIGVGVATVLVAALGAFALGLLLSERLNDRSPWGRSPLHWR